MEKSQDSVDVIKREFAQSLPGVDVGAAAVTGRIRRANFHLNRNAEEVFDGFNTTGASFDILAALYAVGPPYQLTPTDLYRGHMMSSAGVTARLDVVERAGLVALARPARPTRRNRHADQGGTEDGEGSGPGPLPASGICRDRLYRTGPQAAPESNEASDEFASAYWIRDKPSGLQRRHRALGAGVSRPGSMADRVLARHRDVNWPH